MHPRKPLLAVSDYVISPKMRKDFCIEAHWLCTRIHPLYDKSFFALASGARTRHPKFNVFDAPAPGTNPAPRARAPPSRYFRRSLHSALTSHRRALFSQNPAPMPEDLVPVCTLGSCGGVRDRCADVPEVEAWEAEEVPVRALVMAEREGIKGGMR